MLALYNNTRLAWSGRTGEHQHALIEAVMHKFYKHVGAVLQAFSIISWFGILVARGSTAEAFASIVSILLVTTGASVLAYVKLAKKNKDLFIHTLTEYQMESGVFVWALIWLVPALIIGPWVSFIALSVTVTLGLAGIHVQAFWAREELRRQRTLFDNLPPF